MLLENLNHELRNAGAVLVGYGDLAEIPAENVMGYPWAFALPSLFRKKPFSVSMICLRLNIFISITHLMTSWTKSSHTVQII